MNSLSILFAGLALAGLQPAEARQAEPRAAIETNLAVFQSLAAACSDRLETDGAVALRLPAARGYLIPPMVDALRRRGVTVYDSTAVGVAAATVSVDGAGVVYQRAGRRTLRRHVRLDLTYVVSRPDGRVVDSGSCTETREDMVPNRLDRLEDARYPDTRGTPPRDGFVRRNLKPAAVVTASAVSVFLLFTLRSDRSGDGT